uniref:ABC transporter domain-containing protein n=1 Tax=Chenopodium quinoa TaxID=63459 RepID=A0A803KRW0_CHEQI
MAASNGSEYFELDVNDLESSFPKPSNAETVAKDEDDLIWDAIERLPSFKRSKFALIRRDDDGEGVGAGVSAIDVTKLDRNHRELVVKSALQTSEQDNYNLVSGIKERFTRDGLELPKVEVRFENLNITAEVQTGKRALPTLINFTRDKIEGILKFLRISRPQRHTLTILNNVSGYVKPGRMTLLLGPPGSGKSTLLLALAGKLDNSLKKSGNITYNGHELSEFCPQRTSAYISQTDNHIGELTVRETFDFAARCQGASESFSGYMEELIQLEKETNIHPNPEIDAYMKALSVGGKKHSIATDYLLKVLGLDICADTVVGDDMNRGVSGGQRKRVTSGELIVGPKKTLFMDEISTGLDSSTTFQIVKCMGNFVHQMDGTVLMALLQPAPETFDIFDDLMLLSEGHMVYHGPRADVLDFFESLGFRLPPRKGVADFLQEVTSKKDQEQYWADLSKPYRFVSAEQIAEAFRNSRFGKMVGYTLSDPYDKRRSHPLALSKTKFALPKLELFKACFSREVLLIRRQSFLYIFRTIQVILVGFITGTTFLKSRLQTTDVTYGNVYLASLFYGITHMMFNGFSELALMIFRLPVFYKQRDNCFYPAWAWSLSSWVLRVPYSVIESVAWSCVVYYLVGFAPAAGSYDKMMVDLGILGVTLILCSNCNICERILGDKMDEGLRKHYSWAEYFRVACYTDSRQMVIALKKAQSMIPDDVLDDSAHGEGKDVAITLNNGSKKGMILPFQPLSMTFHNVNYFVDMPKAMKAKVLPEKKLQLLSNVSGVFSPGVLTALVGSSGAGKTTMMDVLAGRKTGGYIEGDIRISGYPKVQHTFARISGYVEQNDIHSPQVTVEESLWFSSLLRLPKEISKETKKPGTTGLSTEQRKRLTIGVELVANPSIIFMDEPTSGLDARAAAIVMRTVRNTVDTGRTVICTIHQPSIDIFEAFDELLLMKRGGQVIYGGKLGVHSCIMIDYFQGINGIPRIPGGYNPATWMLEITTPAVEERLGQDFASIYRNSSQFREVEALIEQMSMPPPGSEPLRFDTTFSQDIISQFWLCLKKQFLVYWRSPQYNAVRFLFTTFCALVLGSIFWGAGSKRDSIISLITIMGALHSACLFLGVSNASSVQPVVSTERTVFYREKAAGMYTPLAYAAAQALVEVPYIAAQTLAYGIITYFMIGFERTFRFLIPKRFIPGWWIWFYYICPVAWTLRGIISSQLGDVETIIVGDGFQGSIKEYLDVHYGYGPGMIGVSAVVLLGFTLLLMEEHSEYTEHVFGSVTAAPNPSPASWLCPTVGVVKINTDAHVPAGGDVRLGAVNL